MANRNRRFALAAIALTFMFVAMRGAARAATITVNSRSDPGGTLGCSLRQAITNANAQNQSGSTHCAAGTGTDTIEFSTTGTITLQSTLPAIVSGETLTITGPTTSPGITISGGNAVELMVVNSGAMLTLQFLTLEDGSATGNVSGFG
ncbi:MAG: hypothetical protein WBQ86_11570, partial [Candidatus Binatus sp.]